MMVDDVITAPRAAQDAAPDGAADVAPPSPWLVLSQSGRPEPRTTVDPRRIAIQVAATAALVILVVALVGPWLPAGWRREGDRRRERASGSHR